MKRNTPSAPAAKPGTKNMNLTKCYSNGIQMLAVPAKYTGHPATARAALRKLRGCDRFTVRDINNCDVHGVRIPGRCRYVTVFCEPADRQRWIETFRAAGLPADGSAANCFTCLFDI
jgi:hypothetical protein